MNKTEAEYGTMLLARQAAGEIVWYGYERWTFKLADDTRYTPDFAVMLANGELEAHEVKGGFEREDAHVKRKVAAEQFPIRFIFAQKKEGRWTITEI